MILTLPIPGRALQVDFAIDSAIMLLVEEDPVAAIKQLADIRRFASEQRNFVEEARSYYWEGEAHYYLNELDACLEDYFASRNLLKEHATGAYADLAKTYAAEAFIYLNEMQLYHKAIEVLREGFSYAQAARESLVIGDFYSNFGSCFSSLNQLDSAIHYYTLAFEIDKRFGDQGRIASDLINLGRLHVYWKSYVQGQHYYHEALQYIDTLTDRRVHSVILNNLGMAHQESGALDSAGVYLSRALAKSYEISDSVQIAHRLNNIGLLYAKQKKFSLAEQHFARSLSIYRRRGMHHWLSRSMSNLANLHADRGRHDLALRKFQLAREIAEEHDLIDNLAQIYPGMIKNFKATGKYVQALDLHERLLVLRDTLFSLENKRQLSEFDARYRAQEKQVALEKLSLEHTIQKQELAAVSSQRRTLILILIALIGLATAIIGLLYFRQKLREKEQEKVQALHLQEIDRLRGKVANVLDNTRHGHFQRLSLEELNVHAVSPLTQREFELLGCIAEGLSNKEIAQAQFVSVNTVKFHLKNIYDKLDVRNRVQAVQKLSSRG